MFALGGTGRIGRETARMLARDREIAEIAIAGRDLAIAEHVSAEIGPKATPVEVDATDEASLAGLVEPYDLIVNTAGPDFRVALPAVRAAIAAGTHYCDIAADGPSTEAALSLDGVAKKAGVTALTGIGHMPGESNLMLRHAANQLDSVDEVRFCAWFSFRRDSYRAMGDPEEMRASGRINASWQTILAWVAGPVRTYRDGRWIDVDPFEQVTDVSLPGGTTVSGYLVASSEAITLPRHLPGVRTVAVLMSLDPPPLNELLRTQARRVADGEADVAEAALTLLETVAGDTNRWLGRAHGIPPGFGMLASAQGLKDSRSVRYSCWPASAWGSTVGPLVMAARGILRGEIRQRGVFPPEAVLEPIPFLRAASRFGHDPPRRGQLLGESYEPPD